MKMKFPSHFHQQAQTSIQSSIQTPHHTHTLKISQQPTLESILILLKLYKSANNPVFNFRLAPRAPTIRENWLVEWWRIGVQERGNIGHTNSPRLASSFELRHSDFRFRHFNPTHNRASRRCVLILSSPHCPSAPLVQRK
jgi:hypothetical protein